MAMDICGRSLFCFLCNVPFPRFNWASLQKVVAELPFTDRHSSAKDWACFYSWKPRRVVANWTDTVRISTSMERVILLLLCTSYNMCFCFVLDILLLCMTSRFTKPFWPISFLLSVVTSTEAPFRVARWVFSSHIYPESAIPGTPLLFFTHHQGRHAVRLSAIELGDTRHTVGPWT